MTGINPKTKAFVIQCDGNNCPARISSTGGKEVAEQTANNLGWSHDLITDKRRCDKCSHS